MTSTDREIRQRGLYYEELEPGITYTHAPGRTVADNILFSTLTMNPAGIHFDAVLSEQTQFGQRLVNSLFTLSTLIGLSVGHLTQGTTVANLGFSEVTFPRPVFVGDTLFASTTVAERRLSKSRSDSGVVMFEHTARNQRGEVVATARRAALMIRTTQ